MGFYDIQTPGIPFPVGMFIADDAEHALNLFLRQIDEMEMLSGERAGVRSFSFATGSGTDEDVTLHIGHDTYTAKEKP